MDDRPSDPDLNPELGPGADPAQPTSPEVITEAPRCVGGGRPPEGLYT
jgi:hypothetical protein